MHQDAAVGDDRRAAGGRLLGVTIALAVVAVGIADIMAQLTLMRELLNVFAGNELVFGVILGNWLVLTGAGAYLARLSRRLRRPLSLLIAGQVVVAVAPVASVYALRVLHNVVFIRGAELGLTEAAVSSFVLLLPYCIVGGGLHTLACTLLSKRRDAHGIAGVYFLDSIGGVIGGLLFTFVLVFLLGHFGILYVSAAVNLTLAVAVAAVAGRRIAAGVTAAVGVALAVLVAVVDLDAVSLKAQYAGWRIVYHGNSPYGSLLVTESAGQHNFISSGLTLFTTDDVEQAEETVHYGMAQRPAARDVLLIGGGVSGTIAEILKYPVRRVDYVELDPLILEVAEQYLPGRLADPRVHVATTDGRLFVKQADRRYDVVLVDMPQPSTLQVNRFYTVEFFGEVRRILKPGGVLCFSLGTYENYLSPELTALIAVTHKTLRAVFGRVLILPPGRVFFLASDGELTTDIAGRLEKHGIQTYRVRRSYLGRTDTAPHPGWEAGPQWGALAPHRMEAVRQALSDEAEVNRDFSPVLYYHQLRRWMSRFRTRFGLLGGFLAVVLVLFLLQVRRVSFAIFTTGFAASALEVVLLVSFQILHGVVYHKLGMIITMFMLGLAAGSLAMSRWLTAWGRRALVRLEFSIAAYAVVLPLALMGLGRLGGGAWMVISAEVVVPLLTLLLAVLVGMEFPLAARVDFQGVAPTAGRLYLADLVGACLGAMLVSTVLIPLISVTGACAVVAALNVASGGVLLLKRRR